MVRRNFIFAVLMAVFTLLGSAAVADEFVVGNSYVTVPTPAGFTRVSPDTPEANRFFQSVVQPDMTRLAAYMNSEDIDSAATSPTFSGRYILFDVPNEVLFAEFTVEEFSGLKDELDVEFSALERELIRAFPEIMGTAGAAITDVTGINTIIEANGVALFAPHEESDRTISYSIAMKVATTAGTEQDTRTVTGTVSMLLLNSKIVSVYVYGNAEDMAWTQEFSADWVSDILQSNSP